MWSTLIAAVFLFACVEGNLLQYKQDNATQYIQIRGFKYIFRHQYDVRLNTSSSAALKHKGKKTFRVQHHEACAKACYNHGKCGAYSFVGFDDTWELASSSRGVCSLFRCAHRSIQRPLPGAVVGVLGAASFCGPILDASNPMSGMRSSPPPTPAAPPATPPSLLSPSPPRPAPGGDPSKAPTQGGNAPGDGDPPGAPDSGPSQSPTQGGGSPDDVMSPDGEPATAPASTMGGAGGNDDDPSSRTSPRGGAAPADRRRSRARRGMLSGMQGLSSAHASDSGSFMAVSDGLLPDDLGLGSDASDDSDGLSGSKAGSDGSRHARRLAEGSSSFGGSSPPFSAGTWMTGQWPNIQDTAISSIWMPGSHDAGTFDLSGISFGDCSGCDSDGLGWGSDVLAALVDESLGNVNPIVSWATAQVLSLYDQLSAGSRYLDLRVFGSTSSRDDLTAMMPPIGVDLPAAFNTSGYYLAHCVISNSELGTYLQQITKWLQDHDTSKEVIILHFYQFYGGPWEDSSLHAGLQALVQQYIPAKYIATGVTPSSTLSQIAGSGGPKVILAYEGPVPEGGPFVAGFITRNYDSVQTQSQIITRDNVYYSGGSYSSSEYGPRADVANVFVMEGVLTPDGDSILDNLGSTIESLLPFIGRPSLTGGSLLINWEGDLNWYLVQNMYNNWLAGPGMILMLDNTQADWSTAIAWANLPTFPGPASTWYGTCSSRLFLTSTYSSSTQLLPSMCKLSADSACATGYEARSSIRLSGPSCECQCCSGRKCGCGYAAGELCP
mmetsp:Transcript_39720/g.88247  ORF Transcript_39720/g.88247 Transcript_39720/m.88247 type:complete len:778 (-) Transcript_39720:366-2699(-)